MNNPISPVRSIHRKNSIFYKSIKKSNKKSSIKRSLSLVFSKSSNSDRASNIKITETPQVKTIFDKYFARDKIINRSSKSYQYLILKIKNHIIAKNLYKKYGNPDEIKNMVFMNNVLLDNDPIGKNKYIERLLEIDLADFISKIYSKEESYKIIKQIAIKRYYFLKIFPNYLPSDWVYKFMIKYLQLKQNIIARTEEQYRCTVKKILNAKVENNFDNSVENNYINNLEYGSSEENLNNTIIENNNIIDKKEDIQIGENENYYVKKKINDSIDSIKNLAKKIDSFDKNSEINKKQKKRKKTNKGNKINIKQKRFSVFNKNIIDDDISLSERNERIKKLLAKKGNHNKNNLYNNLKLRYNDKNGSFMRFIPAEEFVEKALQINKKNVFLKQNKMLITLLSSYMKESEKIKYFSLNTYKKELNVENARKIDNFNHKIISNISNRIKFNELVMNNKIHKNEFNFNKKKFDLPTIFINFFNRKKLNSNKTLSIKTDEIPRTNINKNKIKKNSKAMSINKISKTIPKIVTSLSEAKIFLSNKKKSPLLFDSFGNIKSN